MKRHFFSWKSRTNHKTHKYNQNQQQSHVPYKNSPQHQIFYIKEKTHIYILVSPCGEYLLLCGWQTVKLIFFFNTTSRTVYITQTSKSQSSTLSPSSSNTRIHKILCKNGLLLPPNKNTVSSLCFFIQHYCFSSELKTPFWDPVTMQCKKLDLSNWTHFMNLQRTK